MATSEIIVSFGSSVIALLGGGGFVLVSICAFLSKYMADRTIEGHKTALNMEMERLKNELAKESDLHKLKIRKAEILFEREMQAMADFSALSRKVRPLYSHPNMEWDDACAEVSSRFHEI